MPRHSLIFALALVAATSACGRDEKPPESPSVFDVFPQLPLPPQAQFVSRAGSSDALQLVFRSPTAVDAVAGYYREALSRGDWRLVSDNVDPAGAIVLYAERNGPPLWVRISKAEGAAGSLVEVNGAAVRPDSGRAAGTPATGYERSRARPDKPVE